MNLKQRIEADFKRAMLGHDQVGKETLGCLKSAIKYKEVEKQAGTELTDADVELIVGREVKSRTDSIAIYRQANELARAAKETAERTILQTYLPRQLTPEQLQAKISDIIKNGSFQQTDFGQIMSQAKAKLGRTANGAAIAAAVRGYFSK